MRYMISVMAAVLLASVSSAQVPSVWKIEHDGWVYEVARAATVEEAIAVVKKRHQEMGRESPAMGAAKSPDIRNFKGLVLAVGPDNNTGMVTASTRGEPVPMIAVYHDGQNAIRWSPVEVQQLPPTQRVTPAEQFTRSAPASTTANAVKPVAVVCKTGT